MKNIINFIKNYKIKIIILISIVIIFILLKINSIENFDNKKIWAMSFGAGGQNYYDALNRISDELKKTNIFDEIIMCTDNDLKNDNEFWKKHSNFIENNKRGYGYWLWKPYLIMKTLEKMNYNDILFYLDAGCEITDYSQNSNELLKKNIEKCDKSNILYTDTGHNERMYTKMDLLNYMNLNNDFIMNSNQNQATIIIIKKVDITMKFVKDWYNISCNYDLINDTPSLLENDITFIEHRHDQSVFSILLKTDEYKKMNNKENIFDSYPIILSRKRNG